MSEEWRPVSGFEFFYSVSDLGRLQSKRTNRLLNPRALRNGYLVVGFSDDRKRRVYYVHRVVLEAFNGACPTGLEARHGPGGALDNRLVNLAWGTHKENLSTDKERDHTTPRGEHQGSAKLTWEQVCEIRRRLALGELGVSLAEEFHVSQATVSMVKHGKHWAYPPEEW